MAKKAERSGKELLTQEPPAESREPIAEELSTPDSPLPTPSTNVALLLPLGELPPTAYVSRHMEITGLTDRQARALRRLIEGAKAQQLVLLNGKCVNSAASLVRYLLEQVPV